MVAGLTDGLFQSPQAVYAQGGMDAIASDTAQKSAVLKKYGINYNLAPVADVADDPGSFIYSRTIGLDDEASTPNDWDLERKEFIHHDKPKTGTESLSVPAPKSVLSDEEFDKLVAQHSMPSLADIYKKGLKQNVLRPVAAYAHKN